MQKPSPPRSDHSLSTCPKSSGKPCTYCSFNHKFGQCPATEARCNICQKIGHYAKVCRNKYRKTKQNNDRSNHQPARCKGNKKKSTNIHLVADDGEILETTQRENITWIDSYRYNLFIQLPRVPRDIQRFTMPTKQGVTKHSQGYRCSQ